ncbi:MAG: signal peptidase I [Thermoleophilia bacterium]
MKRSTVVDYGVIAVVAVVLALVIQAFVVKPYRIPSPSMERTLMVGDRVLVNRLIYHFRSVHRGDIVVFEWPPDRRITFIKRVIGVPGDTISLSKGRVFVNGVLQTESYVPRQDGQTLPTLATADAAGSASSGLWSLQTPYKVPPGHYFMMGDNRTQSDDSRAWGPISKSDIIGQAFLIYWPFGQVRIL